MRILHIGLCAKSESLPYFFRKVATVYDEMQPHEAYDNGKDYDVCFMQIQNEITSGQPTTKFLSWVKRLKDNGCKVINWTGDMRNETPRWMIEFAPNVTITAFSNQRDVDYCNSIGVNAKFLQIGIDQRIFTPEGLKSNSHDIVFLANNYGNQFPLGSFRRDIVNALKSKYGSKFGVYGNGWSGASGNLNSSQYDEAALYRGAKIAISCSHYDSDRYTSDRLFRALGCGVATVVHHYKGIEKDFKDSLATFKDISELMERVDFFLGNDEIRLMYAAECHEISKRFTYDEMVKQIIEL